MNTKPIQKSWTTISGYYIHDCRKVAKYAFGEFLICVKRNEKNHCYDIFIRESINDNGEVKKLDIEELKKFRDFHPKGFNVILLSDNQADFMCS